MIIEVLQCLPPWTWVTVPSGCTKNNDVKLRNGYKKEYCLITLTTGTDAHPAPQRLIRSMQFVSVSNKNFPSVYDKFLDSVNFFNFDLSWVVSIGCFLEVDFHDWLLWTTITPVVIMGLLGVTYVIAVNKHRASSETLFRETRQKHVTTALLITFLVYSSVSSVVFQMFACDKLDNGKIYLRADYTIECDSDKHRALQIYAGLMIILYPVGIPALYAGLLFSNRRVMRDEKSREEYFARSISNLWKPYKPQRFYYEVVECGRRILLTGAVVFIYPNTASQIAVAFAIAVFFVFVSEAMVPYNCCVSDVRLRQARQRQDLSSGGLHH